jgi:two-component system, OmpR family, response regulator QseB
MDRETRGRHLLLVEDNPAIAELMSEQLGSLGYSVDCALDGNRGVTMACTGDYAAMLLDLDLPEYDGVEVLHILRKRMVKRRLPVIVITGDVERTRLRDLNRESIDGYLIKPVDLTALSRELARVTMTGDPLGSGSAGPTAKRWESSPQTNAQVT